MSTLGTAGEKGANNRSCGSTVAHFNDAVWDSYALGGIRVLELSLTERRCFYASALHHPAAVTLSDAEMALHLGVAESFVQQLRRMPCGGVGAVARTEDTPDPIVLQAVSLMRRNLESRLSAPNLARQIGVSVPLLSRRFRLAARLSPAATLRSVRMERALELVLDTDLALKEIANQVGYNRPGAFHRAFVRSHGVAPSGLRRLYRLRGRRLDARPRNGL